MESQAKAKAAEREAILRMRRLYPNSKASQKKKTAEIKRKFLIWKTARLGYHGRREMAEKYGITPERIRQIEKEAERMIKRHGGQT
jgi:hypothetical protein